MPSSSSTAVRLEDAAPPPAAGLHPTAGVTAPATPGPAVTRVHCLAAHAREAREFGAALVFDAATDPPDAGPARGVVLAHGGEARAATLLEQGVTQVFVGDAALVDASVMTRLVARFGGARVGVYARLRRLANHWSFETVSNADFKVVTPSTCEPDWEILRSDGSVGAPRASRWLAQMVQGGAQALLVQVDIRDDADLNLCAGLVETFGDRICVAPADDDAPRLDEWVRYGQVRRIALPPALFKNRDALLAPAGEAQG